MPLIYQTNYRIVGEARSRSVERPEKKALRGQHLGAMGLPRHGGDL